MSVELPLKSDDADVCEEDSIECRFMVGYHQLVLHSKSIHWMPLW